MQNRMYQNQGQEPEPKKKFQWGDAWNDWFSATHGGFNPMDYYNTGNQGEWPLPTRPSIGMEAERLQQEHAKTISSYMNRVLGGNIAAINQNWAAKGRGDSGGRNEAIQQTIQDTNWAAGNIAGQGSMGMIQNLLNAQLMREQMDETRMWRQASLNAGDTSGQGSDLTGQLLMMALLGGGG